jgi:ActR/RegA family two-component response regulator
MGEQAVKNVLIVDDDTPWYGLFRRRFGAYSEREGSPYAFNIDTAASATEAIEKMERMTASGPPPDVVVLDIHMEASEAGLLPMLGLSLVENARTLLPVVVVFTGYPTYQTCVQFMRTGAWDYIKKEDLGPIPAVQVVVDSVVARLRQLDLRTDLEEAVGRWLLDHGTQLHAQYAGQIIAFWHIPEVTVVASGANPFELGRNLALWRAQHQQYEEPYLMRLPKEADGKPEVTDESL